MPKPEEIIPFPMTTKPHFRMIDVGRKRPTHRRAIACGTIAMSPDAFHAVQTGTVPKGNVLALAEAAGISGAKKTSDLLPMCHNLPLDQVTIHCSPDEASTSITAYAQAAAFAKTGVEMEAISGVNAALMTIWDLTKGIDPNLSIGGVKLLAKTGGKSGAWTHSDGIPDWLARQLPESQTLLQVRAAILVMSDRAAKAEYPDESGAILHTFLKDAGAEITAYQVIPDEADQIASSLQGIVSANKPDLLIASGGTGPGPRDVTPEVLAGISERVLEGLGDLMRRESLYFTDTAWLSRMTAAMVGPTLVIAFPGSPKAVSECWDIIAPFIGDALMKIKKQGFGGQK